MSRSSTTKLTLDDVAVGDRVSWIAAGKGARLDRVNGQRVFGTIREIFPVGHPVFGAVEIEGEYTSAFHGHIQYPARLRKEGK